MSAVSQLFIVLVVTLGVTAIMWGSFYRIGNEDWPWDAQARQRRARNQRRRKRVAEMMAQGLNEVDATEVVDAEFRKESADARKAYEEASE